MNGLASDGMERQMTWLDEFSDLKSARLRAETAFYAPLGMLSPLWIAFGAAASAGAAFWFMSRLAKPLNLEALMTSPHTLAPAGAGPLHKEPDPVEAEGAATATFEEAMIDPDAEALVDSDSATADDLATLTNIETAIADDLTKLAGVGPKIAKALAERGVERFVQLAAWTQKDLAAFDAALDLRGRAIRADFIAQARRLAAGDA